MSGTAQIFPVVGSNFNIPNPLPVTGTLTNNNAAPSSDNVGVLPALATASAQSWTNGDQVLLSEDLLGNLRVVIENGATVSVPNNLLTAGNYAILAASAITGSAGAGSAISGGNIGISPNNATSVTNFPPSILVSPGVFDYDDAAAIQAQLDLTAAIAYYSGLTFTSLSGSSANLSVLGNGSSASTYVAGNYSAGTSMDIPTSITLDAQGNANAIFVFKAGSTLKLESGASVLLVNGAQAANVFWVVGTSFTSVWNGIISNMIGTIMAADSITLGGGTLIGRALAQTAAVTLSTTETITVPTGANAGPAVPVVFTGIANVNVVEWAGLTLAPPTNFGTAPSGLVIGGNVSLFAGYTALVTDASGNLKVDIAAGSVTAVISGSVTVGNFPAIQPVSFAGSVTVGNFPATQPVSGTITALQGTSPWVVSGSVTALPSGIQPISGSVAVTNFPAIQTIAGSVTALISGSVTVGNFPALQNVDVTEWDGIVLGAPTTWGTAPTGNIVIGGNVELFAGNTALVADGSSNLKVNIAAGSVAALQGTSPWVVAGALTNNNAAPVATLVGVLPAIAETAYATVTYATGDMVLPVTDLHGALNTDLQAVAGTAVVVASAGVQRVGISGASGHTLDAVITATAAPTDGVATLVVYNSTPPSLTTGQSVATQGDYVGSQFVKPYRRSQTVAQATTISASTTKTTVLAAQAAGVFADISTLIMTVVPGATVDTAFTAILTDGTNNYTISMDTGALGTAVGVPAPINITFNPPLPATTAATVWSVTLSSSTPTVYINIVAVLQKAS
jgi:hypothetical protein